MVLALCGCGLVGLVHFGVLDVSRPGRLKKAPKGAFFVDADIEEVAFKEVAREGESSSSGNPRGLDIAQFPSQQNTDKEHNGKADAKCQGFGHAP